MERDISELAGIGRSGFEGLISLILMIINTLLRDPYSWAHIPLKIRKLWETIHPLQYFPPGCLHETVISTDGSRKDNEMAAAVTLASNSYSIFTKVPGFPSSQRSELFGITLALLLNSDIAPLTVECDPYWIIQTLYDVYHGRLKLSTLRRLNYRSLYKCIISIWKRRSTLTRII